MTQKHICPTCYGKGTLPSGPEQHEDYIYFLHAPKAQRIKIGFSKDVDSRVRRLRNSSAEALDLLVVVRGSREHERAFHICFARLRQHGEWFIADERLIALIKSFSSLEKISLAKIQSSGDEMKQGNP